MEIPSVREFLGRYFYATKTNGKRGRFYIRPYESGRKRGEKGNVLFKDADGRNSGKRNENDSLQPR